VAGEERPVVPPGLVDTVQLDTLTHLVDLEADKTRIDVSVAVILKIG
jgi:hypothetical protein